MRWLIFIGFYLIIDIYAFQVLRNFTRSNLVIIIYIFISVAVVGNFIYQWMQPSEGSVLSGARGYAFGFLLAVMLAKLLMTLFMLGEDIYRIGAGTVNKFSEDSFDMPSRRKFIGQLALGIAAIPFASVLYGMYQGRYNFRVLRYTLYFEDLPDAFDGYKLSQISDVHSGSFDNKDKIKYGVDLLNKQESDLVVFTGDLVNNIASEMEPWKEMFSSITAKDGVYSVLGNHDYGDYKNWSSQEEKSENLEKLKNTHAEMGWNLLLNEHRFIEKNGQRLALVGVENWGIGGFKKAGDLEAAADGLSAKDFKVLLSHDPSHWQEMVKNDDKNFHLTLSGHTHGMQFGIEIPGWFRWSPVQYRYKNWAGIYEEFGRYINVNRGFGYLAFPGRVGIWPEISVIELKKGSKPA
ncbi:metallophosphoesterase [Salegentibacter sp.]|uniref:metallophosphoesterase n=1 Tax=Salegentibacter sp. TaxID=1903072 RepID=UPI003562380D